VFLVFSIGNLIPGTVTPGSDPDLRFLGDGGNRIQGKWQWIEGPDSITVEWDLVRWEPPD
jgi:hypothetical protein